MSVSGISSTSLYNTQNIESNFQQIQQAFNQLGQDLQAGNLSAAQSDFATLQNLAPKTASPSSQSNNPIAQAFNQLAKDLQSGNLSAAQQDFTTIQQDFQNQAAQTQTQTTGGHHHHHGGGGSSEISQLLSQLGTALQSGNLSTAQQAFSSLVQQFQQAGQNTGSQLSTEIQSNPQSSSNGVSVTA
jgi:outer membrane protein assembly factor BamD (BamD/ComL family)